MKKTTKLIALVLALVMVVSAFAACGGGETANTPAGEEKTLVIGTQNFDGKFSPFFYTNAYENDVLGLVNVGLLGTDREGAVVLKGIEGEVRPYNGTDYTYTGIANLVMTENADGTVYYDITMRDDIVNSDGTPVSIDDVIFTMYVLLDPTFDGISTFYSLPIEGLEAYRSGMDSRMNLILAAGPDGYEATDYYTEDQYNTFWAAFDAAGLKFCQEIVDYCIAAGYGTDCATAAPAWGYEVATIEEFWAAMPER